MNNQNNSTPPKAPAKKGRLFTWQLILGGVGLAILVGGLEVSKEIDGIKQGIATKLLRSEPPSITGSYLAGRFAASNGDYENADYYLKNTLKNDPGNLEIAGYTYRMNLINGKMDDAVAAARQLYAAGDDASNPEIMVLLEDVKLGNITKAREVLKDFQMEGFNLVVVPLISEWLNLAENKVLTPVKQNETLRRIAEFAPFIYYQTAIINDLAGFEDEALVQYNESITLSKVIPYRVVQLMANLHERRGEWDKADALYARYDEKNPDSQPLRVKGDGKTPPARLISNPREGIAEIFFSTASILHNENLNEEALIYIQQVLYLKPDFPAAQLMRGTILEDSGRMAEALQAYDSLKEDSPYYRRAQIRKAYALNASDESEKALNILNSVAKSDENDAQVNLTRGDIYMRLKKYSDAASAYGKALEESPANKPNLWAVYYARGISLERLEKWDAAEADLKKALEIEPEQPDVMNYLAYTWITRNENLEEAKEMLHKAVVARPNDAHIVDSMGWSLYVLGDYDGAVAYLEKAIELMPVDPTVNDHLGDAYWRLGRKNEARFQWKRALLFNPEPDQEKELNKKLADGLPAVSDQGVAVEESPKLQHAEAVQQQQ